MPGRQIGRGCWHDLVITSYGTLLRLPALAEAAWRLVILDEAQAIKTPAARQTKAAKALQEKARIGLTAASVENHLGDLWSIFDFINPGLLGTAKQFGRYVKSLADRTQHPYGPLAHLQASWSPQPPSSTARVSCRPLKGMPTFLKAKALSSGFQARFCRQEYVRRAK